jgi:ribulose-phosphate 3-epimerase
MRPLIAPSVLSADFLALGDSIDLINRSPAEWIHIDVMDGVFVPNISFGFPILEAIRKRSSKICDLHLMIHEPGRYIRDFRKAGADHISVHLEGNWHIDRLLNEIRESGATAGLVLNPGTPVAAAEPVLHLCDLVLLMSVNPGFGGQKFIPETFGKLAELRQLIERKGLDTKIQIDGGVGPSNAGALTLAGADILVAGNAVFGAADPLQAITNLKTAHTKE